MDKEKILKAGIILSEVKKFAKTIIKKDSFLLDIAQKIEDKIIELGAKPAFPVNLSMDHITAHCTPSHDNKTKARGLLKVDIGTHIDGYIADSAFTLDLENSEENQRLIETAQKSLKESLKILKTYLPVKIIGKTIQDIAEKQNLSPIVNLGGHNMERYELHAGISIPNTNDNRKDTLTEGLYAIEPFITNGRGIVHEGANSGIYQLTSLKPIRNPFSRKILEFINEEYKTLPFASRWIYKKFGPASLLYLRELEKNKNLKQFHQLVESSNHKVSQAEETVLIEKNKIIITTLQ